VRLFFKGVFMAFFSILKQGQIYLNTWPHEAKLGIIFPENRIMKATNFALALLGSGGFVT